MKSFTKIICLVLACLMVAVCFVACGGEKDTTPADSQKPSVNTDNTEETGRKAVKDNVPADLNYGGKQTVTFFYRSNDGPWKYELACEELLNDTLYDAIHYRNIDVENRLGVSITTVGQDGSYGSALSAWNQALSTSVLTNTGDYDGAAIYASQSSALAKDGIYYDINLISQEYGNGYVNLEKPWWNRTLVDELTTYGSLFFLAGDLLTSETELGYCLFFNKDLFNEKFPEVGSTSLYSTVKEGNWTIGALTEYVSQVWDDANSNGIIDDGDVMGWNGLGGKSDGGMDCWLYSLGLNITEMNAFGEPELSVIYDPNVIPAYEAVKKLYIGTQGSYGSSGLTANCEETSMANGTLMFSRANLSSGSSMRESPVNYGVLPMPKFDADQEDYRVIFGNHASFLVLCSNLTEEKAKVVSAVIELMAATSYKDVTPTYYSTVLQGIYSKDQPDAEMYDLILQSFVADFGFAYSTKSIAEVGSIFREVSASADIQNKIDSNKTAYESALAALLSALESVSG